MSLQKMWVLCSNLMMRLTPFVMDLRGYKSLLLLLSLVTGLFFPVFLLNQRWSPPLRLQASHCSTFRIVCDVPSIAVFCNESIECFPGTASKFYYYYYYYYNYARCAPAACPLCKNTDIFYRTVTFLKGFFS